MDFIVSTRVNRYQLGDVIRALFLIFKPVVAWDHIIQSRRSTGFLVMCHLLPMMLLAAAAEGFGLVHWGGKPQSVIHRIHKFTVGEAMVYETMRLLLMLLIVVACTVLIKMFAESFRERNTYRQTFTLVIFGMSPLFLLRLLDMAPGLTPWVTWGVGVLLCTEVLYQGVPPVMEPDPPNAIGLFFMSSLVVITTTGLERFITHWYLTGRAQPLETFISHLAAKLPF